MEDGRQESADHNADGDPVSHPGVRYVGRQRALGRVMSNLLCMLFRAGQSFRRARNLVIHRRKHVWCSPVCCVCRPTVSLSRLGSVVHLGACTDWTLRLVRRTSYEVEKGMTSL